MQSTAYWIDAWSTRAATSTSSRQPAERQLVTGLPTDGSTVYITLWSLLNGNWVYNEYTYTAYSLSSGAGQITNPMPGSTLPGTTVTFNWSMGSQSTAYWLDLGSTPGGNQYFQSGNLGNVQQVTVNGCHPMAARSTPTLYSLIGGQWIANSYTYTAYSLSNGLAVMTLPPNNMESRRHPGDIHLERRHECFGLLAGYRERRRRERYLPVGQSGTAQTTTVYDMPNDGMEVYATLYTLINGQWYYNQYQYQSGAGGPSGPWY